MVFHCRMIVWMTLPTRSHLAAGQLNIAESVDLRVEQAADDGRGLVFDDDGGAGDKGAGSEIAALVDRDFDKLAGLGVEDGADPRGLGRIGYWHRHCSRGFGWDRRREKQYPAQHLDFDTRDDTAVEPAVSLLEGVSQDARILVAIGPRR